MCLTPHSAVVPHRVLAFSSYLFIYLKTQLFATTTSFLSTRYHSLLVDEIRAKTKGSGSLSSGSGVGADLIETSRDLVDKPSYLIEAHRDHLF